MKARAYTEEEVQAILRRAVEQHSQQTALDSDDLLSIAEDMGIPADTMHQAILQVDRDRAITTELAALRRSRRHSLASGFATWAIVNAGLVSLCAATHASFWNACYWTAGVWGTVLLLKTQRTIFPNPDRDFKKAERTVTKRLAADQLDAARHRTLLEREARRARPRPSGGSRDILNQLDDIVEQGVSDLLQAAARKMGVEWKGSDKTPSSDEQNKPKN